MLRSHTERAQDLEVALCPSENGRFIVRHVRPSEPFFYLSDTAWELFHRLNYAEAQYYLSNRAEKGFNSVMIVVLAEHNQLEYPNRYGDYPFLAKPGSSYLPDLARPNPAYFEFVDKCIAFATSLGITVSLVPTWGRYINGGYYGDPILFDEQSAEAFGEFLGHRYPFHPFILGGDSNRYWNKDTARTLQSGGDLAELEVTDFGPVFEAMARGCIKGEKRAIKELAELKKAASYKTFITFHSAQVWLPGTPVTTASAQFPGAEWLSLDCVQSGHHDGYPPGQTEGQGGGKMPKWQSSSPYAPIRRMFDAVERTQPVIDLEAHYESTHHWFMADQPLWTEDDIRNGLWQSLCAGACGYTYGVNSVWQMHNSTSKTHPAILPPTTATKDWFSELDLPGAMYAAVARRIMLSLPDYFARVPDQSIILSSTHEDDGLAGNKLVSAMRAQTWALIHLPYGGSVEIDVKKGLSDFVGPWNAWWIDPRSGGRHIFLQETSLSTPVVLRAPTGGSLRDDWLLLIERYHPRF